MKEKKYLYHYTSIDTLLLILKNKTICFNSLVNVDDLEECETGDIKKLGRFCYASCWTDSDKELNDSLLYRLIDVIYINEYKSVKIIFK